VVHAFESALARLERLPPPLLEVRLMGEFAVWRAGDLLPADAWPRPIARRLFQYFALRRGKPLSRDHILDELWPESHPDAAWTTFRTVYSWLRSALEPHLRSKAPSRYFAVDGDTYRFDPYNRVQVDAETFKRTVGGILAEAEQHDVPPISDQLLAVLSNWAPLLPGLPYEEWLLEPREQLLTLYTDGCLYVAQALLLRNQLRETIAWAERAIAVAPWLEEGYQVLMRAYARLDQRSRGLKVYADATAALERESGIAPSTLTDWLAERLQHGEEI
jgi:DNA-binding SARP family transcriptional activator